MLRMTVDISVGS